MTKRLLAILAMTMGGCGDNAPAGNTCGTGTTEVDGECVATTTCGTGTVDDGAGNCVPDGSVVCTDGTVFDTATGTCVPSDDVCGNGTVLVDGVCQDPSVVTPNVTEAAEPNDDAVAGEITVPGIGQPGFVIGGCITPRDNGTTEDVDVWFFEATGPAVLEIAADGVGGLAAGFYLLNVDQNKPELDAWVRFGINTLSDSAKRQVYVPMAGTYVLVMSDQRSIFGLGPAGNENTCYYTTITQVAMPTPVALTMPVQTGTDSGNVQVFRYTSAAEGTIFRAELTDESDLLDPAWVALRQNTFHGLATDQDGWSAGRARFVGAVNNTQTVDIVVDMEFNSAIAPQPFEIESYSIGATALPVDGSTVTVTKQNGVNPRDPIVDGTTPLFRNSNYYYFDVGSDADVVHFDLTGTEAAAFFILRTDAIDNDFGAQDALVFTNVNAPLDFSDEFVRFLSPGRYYVAVYQVNGVANTTYNLTATLTSQNAPAINVGAMIDDSPISDITGSAWREFAPATSALWVEMTGGGDNLNGDLEVVYYPSNFEGWLDGDIPSNTTFDQSFDEAGTGPAQGRILYNYPIKPFLVRFRSAAGAGADQTFDYAIADRTFTDLTTATEATPATATAVAVPASGTTRFLVRTTGRATITASSDSDIVIRWLDYAENSLAEVDGEFGGTDEVMSDVPSFFGYVAFEIENLDTTAGTVDISVSTLTAEPFVEICPSAGGTGTLVMNSDDAIAPQRTLPFTLSLFGANRTNYIISTNGWLSFEPSTVTNSAPFSPLSFPTTGNPDGVVAGYWDDLQGEVCERVDTDRTIIEWRGFSWNTFGNVHAQVSIYATGDRIEWAIGSEHDDDGSWAVGGVENIDGTDGVELFNGTVGLVGPGWRDVVILP